MENIDIEIVTDNTEEVKARILEAADRVLEAIGMHLEGEAKEELSNAPKRIDTGLLRNSITYAISGQPAKISSYSGSSTHGDTDSTRRRNLVGKPASPPHEGTYAGTAPNDPPGKKAVYVGSNLEYAVYIHEGVRNVTPNRFLKNAFERNKEQIKRYLQDEFQSAVNDF